MNEPKINALNELANGHSHFLNMLVDPAAFEQAKIDAASTDKEVPVPKKDTLSIADNRIVDSASGSKLSENNKMNALADKGLLREIINAAKKNGVDPYTALAMAHQETGYGDIDGGPGNPFNISPKWDEGVTEKDMADGNGVQLFMDLYKKKLDLAKRLGKKDEASQIQAWNGYGKISKASEDNSSMYYGIDVSKNPLDMNQNPVYGKRVLDIRDNIIKKNPEIVKMVEYKDKVTPLPNKNDGLSYTDQFIKK